LRAFERREPLFVSSFTRPSDAARRPVGGSGLALPLVHQDEAIGVLAVNFKRSHHLPELDRTFLESVASQFSLRIKVARQHEALQDQIERLHEADRLKGSFLNAASHELRTPLTSIKGYAEFLEDELGGPLTADQEAFVHEISLSADRLRRLVDDILDYARLEAGSFRLQLQEADLRTVAGGVLSSLHPQIKRAQVRLLRALPRRPVLLRIDPHRIGQVLLNLVGNAIKFTPPGGWIKVSVRNGRDGVRVEVADSGVGVSPRHLERLFDRFYQADTALTRERGGTGLGLAIAKGLVEAHGGSIGVESEPGRGSQFWFELPRGRSFP